MEDFTTSHHKIVQRDGEKKDYGDQISNLKERPLGQRGTLYSTSAAAGMKTTTLHRNLKAVNLRYHNNSK